jgi:hypothetical protein
VNPSAIALDQIDNVIVANNKCGGEARYSNLRKEEEILCWTLPYILYQHGVTIVLHVDLWANSEVFSFL